MTSAEKRCSVCGETKLLCDFSPSKGRKGGVASRCKDCSNGIGRRRYDPERHARYYNENRADRRIAATKASAAKRGIVYDLDDYRDKIRARFAAGRCEMTGIPFVIQSGRHWAAPSIDRIEPSNGYVYSNIRIVLDIMNGAMNAYGEDVLRDVMMKWLAR